MFGSSGLDAWNSIAETGLLLRYLLDGCSKEKTAVPYVPKKKKGRSRRDSKQAPDPAPARPPGDP